jgi:hypothetical protein
VVAIQKDILKDISELPNLQSIERISVELKRCTEEQVIQITSVRMRNIESVVFNDDMDSVHSILLSKMLILQNISAYWPNVKHLKVDLKISDEINEINSLDAFLTIKHLETLTVWTYENFYFHNENQLQYPNMKKLKLKGSESEFVNWSLISNAFPNLEFLCIDKDAEYSTNFHRLKELKKLKVLSMTFIIKTENIDISPEEKLVIVKLSKQICKFGIEIRFFESSHAQNFADEFSQHESLFVADLNKYFVTLKNFT